MEHGGINPATEGAIELWVLICLIVLGMGICVGVACARCWYRHRPHDERTVSPSLKTPQMSTG